MIHSKANALKTTAELLADMAVDARATAHSAQTGHSGLIYVENEDGTATVIGSGDATIATHVGDTTPPPVPTGIAATSVDGTVAVTWDGTLEGETPADFLRVNLYVGGVWFAALAEAGSALTPPQEVGATVEVTATSEDDACLWDGTPDHNVSEPCAPVSVEVRDLFAEGAAELDAAREEAREAIDAVDRTAAEAAQAVAGAVAAAGEAKDAADAASSAADELRRTAATKTEVTQAVDAAKGEVLTSVAADYVDKETGATLATKSEVSQTADSIRSEVSEAYATKESTEGLASRSELEQTATSIRAEVARDYVDKATGATYATKSELKVESDSIRAEVGEVAETAEGAVDRAAALEVAADAIRADVASTAKTADAAISKATSVEQTASGLSAKITETATKADQTATKVTDLSATVDGVSSSVAKAQQTADGAATAASRAQQTADSITSTVEANYLKRGDAASLYATKTEVKQTTDAIRLTAEESLRKVDNLKIGGTNLLIDSGTLPLTLLRPGDDTPGYGGNSLLAATGVDAGYRGNNRVDTNKAWAGLSLNLRKNAEGRIKVGDEVTLSIRVMMDNDATGLRFGLYRVTNTNTDVTLKSDIPGATNSGPHSINAPLLKGGVWYTLWGTFTVDEFLLSPGNSGQRFEQAVDTSYPVHWSSPKLEMGNTPTDWSACPLDIVDSMMETGVNRATGSKDFTAMCKPIPPANGATLSVIDSGSVPGHKSVNYTVPTSGVYDPIAVIPHGVMRVPKKGDTVTVSFNAYAKDGGRIHCFACSDKNDGTNCKKQTVNSEGYRINTFIASDGSNSFDLPANENKRCWYTVTYLEDAQRCPSLIIGRVHAALSKQTTYAINSIKVEFGDVATPWSPAPEDADIKFSTKAELSVEKDRITGVVTEQAGLAGRVSTVEQKADGLTVTLGEVADDASSALTAAEAAADMAQSAATNSADAIAQTNAAVAANTSILDSFSVDELNQVLARVRVVQAGGVPALQLGSTTSGLWAQLTNSQLSFMDASTVVAYISAMKLFISQAQVTGQLGIGGFAWVPRANGNLCLKKV